MTMRFFTREWANGGLDDAAFEQTLVEYPRHLDRLPGPVGQKIREFATTKSLNDSWLDGLRIRPQQRDVELFLITGDLQVGYWLSRLTYSEAHLVDSDIADVYRTFDAREAEVWYDEFDVQGTSDSGAMLFQHRFLLWPDQYGGFAIEFCGFDCTHQPLDDRKYSNRRRPFVIIEDAKHDT